MPSEDERDAALRQIVEFTEQMGNSIQGEAEGQTDDGRPLKGYQIQHGSHNLLVVTVPGWEYFQIIYQVNFPQNIAVQRAVSSQDTPQAGQVEVELNQQDIHQATDELQNHVEDLNLSDIRLEFARTVAQVNSTAALDMQTDGQLILGFQIQSKLFPYRDGFNIAEFEAKVQDTVTTGWIAKDFLSDAYDLEELVEGDISSQSTDSGPNMFQ